ncbi:MAG: arylsulfatase [Verrucomicrobia bacterium]|nr:arylsulfatase [Verrucomicrobiota bacterium]
MRRLTILLSLLMSVVLAATQIPAATSSTTAKPNIVIILADDLGYGDVQCLNPERGKIKTPCLDTLASQGMTFTDAHSGSSVCTPTRYGLLTGRYAWRSRLQSGVLAGYVPPLIAADRLTVPGLLKQNGYHTAIIGKWHLGFTIEGADKKGGGKGKGEGAPMGAITHDGPVTRGFDEFFGFHHARMMKSVFENDRVTQIIKPVDMLPALVKRSTAHITERARAGQPFFVYLPLSSPHAPIVPSKEWQGKSGLGDYGDFVMETDWAVGEVLAAIDKADIAGNTLVVATSDNGCSPTAAKVEKLEAQGHFPSAQLRGYKADIWDGGHRIPFIVRWPGHVKAGSTCDQLICLTDLMATCADLLGTKLPDKAGEDSVSILPALLGKAKQPLHEAVVHHSIAGKFSIRQGPWKLESCAGSGGWGKPKDAQATKQGLPAVQLYNLADDLAEQHNLEASHAEIVKELTALLERYVADGRSTPGPKQKNDVPVDLRKSKAEEVVPEQ